MAESISSASVANFELVETKKHGLYDLFVRIEKDFDKNIKKGLEALAPRLADGIRKTFDAKGKRGGRKRWVITKNPNPLIDLGHLYESFQGYVEGRGDDYVVVVGTDVYYARTLNEGDIVDTDVVYDEKRTQGGSLWFHTGLFEDQRIPEREFMFLADEDVEMSIDTIDSSVKALAQLEELGLVR